MNKFKSTSLHVLIMLVIAINFAFVLPPEGDVEVFYTLDFRELDSSVNELMKRYDKSDILVVLDIDNTILTSSTDLGGDIWYQWQRGKLNMKPTAKQKVDCLFEDAIGLLYELGTMELTDSIIPDVISSWQEKGINVFALTSRSPEYRTATERELNRKGIDFSKTAPRPKGRKLPVYREILDGEMSYMQGIMMTKGMNKGKMLEYLLEKTGNEYSAIVFVDDSKKNVKNMEQEFKDSDIDMNIFFYDKIIEERKAANGGEVLTKKQVRKMYSDWKKLNKTLKAIFPYRYVGGECLGLN